MNAALFRRGRAERFAQIVDEANGGHRRHVRSAADDELRDLLSITTRVSSLPLTVQAQPEFRDGLRAMLMATIEREGIGATAANPEPEPAPRRRIIRTVRASSGARPSYSRRTRTRGAIVIGLAAGTLALSGMSAASGDAIPGDALYGVKRSTERAQLALAGSDISRGQLYLGFAKIRLIEAQEVRGDAPGLTTVLDDMDRETKLGVQLLATTAVDRRDKVALDAIDGFAVEQKREMQKLRNGLSGAAGARAEQSVTLLESVLRRSGALRSLVTCGTAATSSSDALGPVPRSQFHCRQPYSQQRPETPAGVPAGTATKNAPVPANTGTPPVEAASPSTSASTSASAGPDAEPAPPADEDGGLLGRLGDLFGSLGG